MGKNTPDGIRPGPVVYQITLTIAGLWLMAGLWFGTLPLQAATLPAAGSSPLWFWGGWTGLTWAIFGWLLLGSTRLDNRLLTKVFLYLSLFCTGATWSALVVQHQLLPHLQSVGQLATYQACQGLVEAPLPTGPFNQPRRVVRLACNNQTLRLVAQFKRSTPEALLAVGQALAVEGSLTLPHAPMFVGGFDEAHYYLWQGWDATMQVDKTQQLTHPFPQAWWQKAWVSVNRLADHLRQRLLNRYQAALSPLQAQLMASVVLGAHAAPIDTGLKQAFIQSGLIHLLAASGLNVGLIAAVFLLLGRLSRLPLAAYLPLTMAGVALYCLMTGLPPSVLRAGTMLELALLFKLFKRDLKPLTLLVLAGCLLAVHNPLITQSISFQLSFLSTLGLITMTAPLQRWLGFYLTHRLAGYLAVPVVAQLWVFPLIWFTFGQVQLAALPANLLALPLATLVTWTGFVGGGISLVLPVVGQGLMTAMGWATTALAWVAETMAAQDWAVWMGPPPPSIWVAMTYWALILAGVWLTYGSPWPSGLARNILLPGVLLLLCLPLPLQALMQPTPFLALLPHRYGETTMVVYQPNPMVFAQRLTPSIASDLLRYARYHQIRHIGFLLVQHPTNTTPKALDILAKQVSLGQVVFNAHDKDPVGTRQWQLLTTDGHGQQKPDVLPLSITMWQTPVNTTLRLDQLPMSAKKTGCLAISSLPDPLPAPLTKNCTLVWHQDSQQFEIVPNRYDATEGLVLYRPTQHRPWGVSRV
ncbi:MAG: ComEC/Rec2 family competence protein [Cyanobacteria bacterium HKST-UBA04]|nr:ComEC/Rec2 family competence protein [Cyanobacteria bacterium HKST-UBA04]